MEIVRECKCGKALSEKNFSGPMCRPQVFGLPKGTLGNSRARFIRLKCECGAEYLGECVPGRIGGSMRLNRAFSMDMPAAPKATLEPKKPTVPIHTNKFGANPTIKDGVFENI